MLNIYIDELKQILLTCGLIYYQPGTLKLVLNRWSLFMMDNDLHNNYFDSIIIRGIYYIGIGTSRDNIINPSSQFFNYSDPRKSRSLIDKLKNNVIEGKCYVKG